MKTGYSSDVDDPPPSYDAVAFNDAVAVYKLWKSKNTMYYECKILCQS